MRIDKKLKKLGITNIVKIESETVRNISVKVIELLAKEFPFLEEQYNNMLAKLMTCNMYSAEMNANISKVNYIYENRSIYIDRTVDLTELNSLIASECIHYIQDCRYESKKLSSFGICEFNDFAILGFGLNEAMVKYISLKVFDETSMITTNRLVALAKDVLELLDEKILIKGVLIPSDKTQDYILNTFENDMKKILKKFDTILELYNMRSYGNTFELENSIVRTYYETKKKIYTSYFDKTIDKLESREEVEEFYAKIKRYEDSLTDIFEQNEFKTFVDSLSYKMQTAVMRVNKIEKQRSLMIISKNKFQKVVDRLKQMFNLAG